MLLSEDVARAALDAPIVEPPKLLEAPRRITTAATGQDETFRIPRETIKESAIQEYSQLAGEASRRAVEKIKKRFAAEDKKIRAAAKKEAIELTEEDPQYRIFRDIIAEGRIDYQSLVDMGVTKDQIRRLQGVRPGLISRGGALHADKVAQEYGYDSVDAMVEDWSYRKPKKQMVAELAEQLADEQFIGVDDIRSIIFNELVVEEEIAILNKLLKRKPHNLNMLLAWNPEVPLSQLPEVKDVDHCFWAPHGDEKDHYYGQGSADNGRNEAVQIRVKRHLMN